MLKMASIWLDVYQTNGQAKRSLTYTKTPTHARIKSEKCIFSVLFWLDCQVAWTLVMIFDTLFSGCTMYNGAHIFHYVSFRMVEDNNNIRVVDQTMH